MKKPLSPLSLLIIIPLCYYSCNTDDEQPNSTDRNLTKVEHYVNNAGNWQIATITEFIYNENNLLTETVYNETFECVWHYNYNGDTIRLYRNDDIETWVEAITNKKGITLQFRQHSEEFRYLDSLIIVNYNALNTGIDTLTLQENNVIKQTRYSVDQLNFDSVAFSDFFDYSHIPNPHYKLGLPIMEDWLTFFSKNKPIARTRYDHISNVTYNYEVNNYKLDENGYLIEESNGNDLYYYFYH